MNIPIQSQPVMRNVSTAKAFDSGIEPASYLKCVIACATSPYPNKVPCLERCMKKYGPVV